MRFACLVFVLGAVGILGCSSDSGDAAAEPVDCKTTAGVVKKVFQPKCGSSGCHSASDAPDLVSDGIEARVRGVFSSTCPGQTQVVPGKPEASYLYRKLTDTKPSCGSPMPFGAKALSADELACVRDWITAMPGGGAADAGGDTGGADTSVTDTGSGGTDTGSSGGTDTGSGGTDTGSGGADTGAGCGTPVSFSKNVQPIFTSGCASSLCHGGGGSSSLLLTAGASYADLVNVKASGAACSTRTLVVPGNVSSSYLLNKLTGVGMCSGSKMPKTGSITTAQIDTIRSWICNGAKND